MKNKLCPIKKYCFDYGNCTDCRTGDLIKKQHRKIKRLQERERWISVKERMPKETLSKKVLGEYFSERVIALCEDKKTGQTYPLLAFTVNGEWWVEKYKNIKILYWQPLQTLPKDILERWDEE